MLARSRARLTTTKPPTALLSTQGILPRRCVRPAGDVCLSASMPCSRSLLRAGSRSSPEQGATEQSKCAKGTYSDASITVKASCTPCSTGTFQDGEGATACKACTEGYYCVEGAPAALPCPGGRHQNQTLERPMESQHDCVTCPPGTFCSVGTSEPTPCAPGSYNPSQEQETCAPCEAGTYQEAEGATACVICKPGYYCTKGAAAALPCPAGSYSTATDLSDATLCTPCPLGHFCVSGATAPQSCSVATYAGDIGKPLCDGCLKGSYQDEQGASACKDCPDGSFCPNGCATPIPASCDPGTYVPGTFTSRDDCIPCPIGYGCAGGPSQPSICLAGTFDAPGRPLAERAQCAKCEAGSYQDEEGKTSCKEARADPLISTQPQRAS